MELLDLVEIFQNNNFFIYFFRFDNLNYKTNGKNNMTLSQQKRSIIDEIKKNYSLKDTVNLILETEEINKKKVYELCLKVRNEKNS